MRRMIPPTSQMSLTRWKLGVVRGLIMGGLAVMLISLPATAAEPGETSGEFGAADGEKPKSNQPYSLQASDPDAPKDPAVIAAQKKAAADAELAKKKPVDEGPPLYTKWQFWAITGGIVVGLAAAIFATTKIVHSVNGGDVQPCPVDFACFGEGR
jgi:hypothetical protein